MTPICATCGRGQEYHGHPNSLCTWKPVTLLASKHQHSHDHLSRLESKQASWQVIWNALICHIEEFHPQVGGIDNFYHYGLPGLWNNHNGGHTMKGDLSLGTWPLSVPTTSDWR